VFDLGFRETPHEGIGYFVGVLLCDADRVAVVIGAGVDFDDEGGAAYLVDAGLGPAGGEQKEEGEKREGGQQTGQALAEKDLSMKRP
jgi:hypothetical protein